MVLALADLLTVSLTVAIPPGVTPCCSSNKTWRRGSESNRRMQLLQSRALPLGYPAFCRNGLKISRFSRAVQACFLQFEIIPLFFRASLIYFSNSAHEVF